MYPTYCLLPSQHRQIVEEVKMHTGMTLKAALMEAIELLGVKYGAVEEPEQVRQRPNWPVEIQRRNRTPSTNSGGARHA